ncbi:MAG: flagellar biosynthesis protein FlhF [Termitinemataceae bacterium]|nr:MAG: flagellar biosynthesis protein FlhF [Termitinemataceae bacterium]
MLIEGYVLDQTFTVQRKTYEECKERVIELYGPRAKILTQRKIQKTGFLGFFAQDWVEVKGTVPPEMPDISMYSASIFKPRPDSVEKALFNDESAKTKVLAAAAAARNTDPNMQELLNQVKIMHEKLDNLTESDHKNVEASEHESIKKMRELLEQNDFAPAWRNIVLERLRKEIPLDDLDNFYEVQQKVLEWIGESINLYDCNALKKLPHIIVLVGPTGVGKSTTIVKLAARYRLGIESPKYRVGFITIDYYKIGAADQIKEYAGILKAPFYYADTTEDLKKNISLMANDVDIILIDTAGTSPRDAKQIAETKTLLDACGGNAEVHLTVSASTKTADVIEIMRQFEPFAYNAVLITKLDETRQVGNVLSALSGNNKKISYLTNGQESTTETIKKADVMRLLLTLDGFEVDRLRLEKRWLANA